MSGLGEHAAGGLRVSVLGPLRVERDRRLVPLGPKLVDLLLVLLLDAGRAVPGRRLVELLWGSAPPDSVDATLRSHVSHLRRRLGLGPGGAGDSGGELATVALPGGAGYRLELAPERVDCRVFERRVADGHRDLRLGGTADVGAAAGAFQEALELWRGPAFADVAGRPFAAVEIARLDALHRAARRGRAEALLMLGRSAAAIGELTGAVAAEPYDEGLIRLLARALYAQERVDEAAEVCRAGLVRLRRRGLDAPGLHELQRGILTRTLPVADGATVPRHLPPAPPGCVGRDEETERARRVLCGPADRPRTLIVTGPAGVGKSSFALRVSHAVAAGFPDGQLYLNLRGFDPGGPAMPVAEAVRALLMSLGLAPKRIPEGVDNQLALYRSECDRRRLLIVLDNGRTVEQVRPLLPGTDSCAVIVTSRNQLASLVSVECAVPLTLGMLTVAEAREMLRLRLGAAPVDAEPDAVDQLIEYCARLPLTLAVAAARAATYPHFRLASLAAELRHPGNRLDAIVSADAAVDVRAVFSWSYQTLSAPAARLFRLLAVHPGPDVTVAATAGLIDAAPAEARRQVSELAHAHLVTEHRPGRYVLHDMLRAYAGDLLDRHESAAPERHEARRRMLEHYRRSACAAALLVNPYPHDPIEPSDLDGAGFADRQEAVAWFAAEREVLLAVVRLTASGADTRTPPEAPVWDLIRALVDFVDRRGYWHDWLDLEHLTLDLAQRLDDATEQARARRRLGLVLARLGRRADAERELRLALDMFGDLADRDGRARTHHNLAWLLGIVGRHHEALGHARRSAALFAILRDRVGSGRALNAMGWCWANLGDLPGAVDACRRAVAVLHDCGDSVGEAATWDSLGFAHVRTDAHDEAVAAYRRAAGIYACIGDRYGEASALERLGDAHAAAGNPDEARLDWRRAATILTALGHPAAANVHERLRSRPAGA